MAVTLRPMAPAEFAAWSQTCITSYAADSARAQDLPLDDAKARAQSQFAAMLPDGLDTTGVRIFVVVDDDGEDAGTLWLGPSPERPTALYAYDVAIATDRRGQGLGRAAMLLAEAVARGAGFTAIELSVFGFNTRARQLYDSIGYRAVATTMTKPIQR